MLKAALMFSLAMVSTMISVSPGEATQWLIHNKSNSDFNVAIVYQKGGGYVSEGWFKVTGCGGTRNVFDDTVEATNFYIRARGIDFPHVVEGSTLFCTRSKAFTFSRANDPKQCDRQGGELKAFQLVSITTKGKHTTNINAPRNPKRGPCID